MCMAPGAAESNVGRVSEKLLRFCSGRIPAGPKRNREETGPRSARPPGLMMPSSYYNVQPEMMIVVRVTAHVRTDPVLSAPSPWFGE